MQKSLDEQGIEYEVVPGPWPGRGQRGEIERLSGQPKYPSSSSRTAPCIARSPGYGQTIKAGKLFEKQGAPS